MDTALHEDRQHLQTGRGTISLVFGEFARGIATVLLDNGTLLHVHDAAICSRLLQQFGPRPAGRSIIYKADRMGIVHDYRAL